jgi:sugar (pentulose or hexulose) kinase
VLSVPAADDGFLYISSGTWSLMGIESPEPVLTDLSEKYDFTNEGGVFGTIRVLKNIMGLWIEQESRRQWKREGKNFTFDELSEMALASKPLQSLINPDDPSFSSAGNMPKRICEYCEKTGQHVPETIGEIVRCIFESLSLRYRWTAEKLEEMTGKKYPVINIVGGGTKEEMLSQFAADASGCVVCAGPVEATALGNIAMQMIAGGELADAWQARSMIRASVPLKQYTPDPSAKAAWDEGYSRFLALIGEN